MSNENPEIDRSRVDAYAATRRRAMLMRFAGCLRCWLAGWGRVR